MIFVDSAEEGTCYIVQYMYHIIFNDLCIWFYYAGNALAEQLRCEDGQSSSAQTSRDQSQAYSQGYKELNQRRQRCKDLGRIVQKMTTKKQLMVSI